MSKLQKILLAGVLALLAGMGVHEAGQAHQWGTQVQAIQAEQAAIPDQIKQLMAERDEATNRVAVLLAELAKFKAEAAELERLRAEEARLKAAPAPVPGGVQASDVDNWIKQVGELKRYVSEHPEENIPEMQFLTDREWLLLAATPRLPWEESDAQALQELKGQAEGRFAEPVEQALRAYAAANDGKFPTALSQLQPYCDADVEEILQERYEIKPASILPADSVKTIMGKKPDWVIAAKNKVNAGSADRLAIYAEGYAYFW